MMKKKKEIKEVKKEVIKSCPCVNLVQTKEGIVCKDCDEKK